MKKCVSSGVMHADSPASLCWSLVRAKAGLQPLLAGIHTKNNKLKTRLQVISILHHHFENHHATGEYVPTDFFETAAMLITLVLCGKYLVRRSICYYRLVPMDGVLRWSSLLFTCF